MTQALFIILVAIEIGFAVFQFIVFSSKNEWTFRRLMVNVGELVVYLIMAFLPGIDTGFRFFALYILLGLRVVVAGIFAFIYRKNEKFKSKAAIFLSALLSVILIAVNLIPAFLFADYSGRPLTGEYSVGQKKSIIVDHSRKETFENDGSDREVPLYFYYPENVSADNELPLVVFSHGAFGYYQSNTSSYMELASHGYVVVSLDHPYHSLFTTDSDGKMVVVDSDFYSSANSIGNDDGTNYTEEQIYEITSKWMELRIADVEFVLDTLEAASEGVYGDAWCFEDDSEADIASVVNLIDVDKIGLFGHSLGGATSVTVGRRDDVKAVIDLDGTMLGEETGVENGIPTVNEDPYTTPLLCIDKEEHHNELDTDGYVNKVILDNAEVAYETGLIGAEHMDLTDLPLFSPALAGGFGSGDIDHEKCIDTVNGLILSFFDCYLKGEGTFTVPDTIDVRGN